MTTLSIGSALTTIDNTFTAIEVGVKAATTFGAITLEVGKFSYDVAKLIAEAWVANDMNARVIRGAELTVQKIVQVYIIACQVLLFIMEQWGKREEYALKVEPVIVQAIIGYSLYCAPHVAAVTHRATAKFVNIPSLWGSIERGTGRFHFYYL